MALLCTDRLFNEDESIVFESLDSNKWLLQVSIISNTLAIFDLFVSPDKLNWFYFRTINMDNLNNTFEFQTSYNKFKLVCKSAECTVSIAYGLV